MVGLRNVHLAPSSPLLLALSAMSFSRTRLILGLQPRLVFAACAAPSLAARRLISTSTCSHAQHQHKQPLETLTSKINERHSHSAHLLPQEQDGAGNALDAYRHGPSALDKAVHLFFFTEIIRGNSSVALLVAGISFCQSRHVDCARKLFPTAIHHHVPF